MGLSSTQHGSLWRILLSLFLPTRHSPIPPRRCQHFPSGYCVGLYTADGNWMSSLEWGSPLTRAPNPTPARSLPPQMLPHSSAFEAAVIRCLHNVSTLVVRLSLERLQVDNLLFMPATVSAQTASKK